MARQVPPSSCEVRTMARRVPPLSWEVRTNGATGSAFVVWRPGLWRDGFRLRRTGTKLGLCLP
jgi:hypothetical protein